MNPKISVVIPVYNCSKYLRKCLDSVLNQTLNDIEVICVDDGSTDDSLSILQYYELYDPRVIVICENNKGGGAARNIGMKMARGKYLSFLDADDFFELNMLEQAYINSETYDADITIFQYRNYYDRKDIFSKVDRGISAIEYIAENKVVSHVDIPNNLFSITNTAPWNKLFKYSFIVQNQIQFQEIRKCNDVYFCFTALYFAERITFLKKPLLSYRITTRDKHKTNTYKYPCDIYFALLAVRDRLSQTADWHMVETNFIQEASTHCQAILDELEDAHPSEHKKLLNLLNSEGFENLGILNRISVTQPNTKNIFFKLHFICIMIQKISSFRRLIRTRGFLKLLKDGIYHVYERFYLSK